MSGGTPRRIGKWRIEGNLGAGGMGTVYLARRDQERVALKVVHPGFASDPHFRDRFRREVSISRRVSGPYVAELLDADVDAAQPWLASAYVPGPTLAEQVTAEGPLGEQHTLALALALASALRDIHRAQVVHRDLKPSNVILAPSGPVVIDFGIAGAVDATSLTRTGAVMGSAGWMAPEQLRGEPTGPPADVFAWAATVCFAATGTSPFGSGRAEPVSYRVVHEDPVLTGVPDGLRPLVAQALAKNAADRPTPDELVTRVGSAFGSAPTVVGENSLTGEVTRLWTLEPTRVDAIHHPPRHRKLPLATAAAAVVAVAAAIGAWLAWPLGFDNAAGDEATTAAAAGTTTTEATTTTTTTTTTTSTAPPTTAPPATVAPTTTAPPPTTTPPPPADPALEGVLDPTSADDINRFINFAESHMQQVVRLDTRWNDSGGGDYGPVNGQPNWEPGRGLLYVSGPCDDQWCTGGMEVMINDLGSVSDASLYYDSGQWILRGRFAVQGTAIETGGIHSVALRAVPVG